MRCTTWFASAGLAGVLVAGTAFAAGGAKEDGGKAPQLRGGLGDPADGVRVVDGDRGPFYGIRVNSMNFAADAKNVASFEYTIAGLLPGDGREKYQLVRTVWRGDVLRNTDCDEVLALAFPAGASLRYVGKMQTTRWIRDVGPNGKTPVGGFVGELSVAVTRGDAPDALVLPLLAFRVMGTQGLRPMRGDPNDPDWSPMERCSAPLHDEGFYQGGFDRRTLTVLARGAQQAGNSLQPFRALWDTRIVGTFEGRLEMEAAASLDSAADRFGNLSKGGWWFDGVLGWKARRAALEVSGQ